MHRFHFKALFKGRRERPAEPRRDFALQRRRFTAAQFVIRAFYAFLLYLAFTQIKALPALPEPAAGSLLWPVAWVGWFGGAGIGVRALLAFYFASNILGVFLAHCRVARVAIFLGLLEYVALTNSYGKIGHSLHLPLFVAGVFVFLPGGWSRPVTLAGRRRRQDTLLVFWTAQAAVLMSYTMSGAGKIGCALYQIARLQPNAFAPGALGAHVAQRLMQTGSYSLLGDWIIRHPWLTWPLMPSAIYLEFFAFWVAFRPSLGRPWAAALILFHIGTFITMTISFPQNSFLLALLFFASPFEPEILGWREMLLDVPLAGACWGKLKPGVSRYRVAGKG